MRANVWLSFCVTTGIFCIKNTYCVKNPAFRLLDRACLLPEQIRVFLRNHAFDLLHIRRH